MRSSFLFLLIFLLPCLCAAQDCTLARYQAMLKEADQAVKKGEYDLAINKLQSAKTCRPEKEAEVNKKLANVFETVNREREEAIKQKQLADAQRDSTEKQKTIAVAEKLRAEKRSRFLNNSALFQKVKAKNPSLAFRIAGYNLKKYQEDPAITNVTDLETLCGASDMYFHKYLKGWFTSMSTSPFQEEYSCTLSPHGNYAVFIVEDGDAITILNLKNDSIIRVPVYLDDFWVSSIRFSKDESRFLINYQSRYHTSYSLLIKTSTGEILNRLDWAEASWDWEYEAIDSDDIVFIIDNEHFIASDGSQVTTWEINAGVLKPVNTTELSEDEPYQFLSVNYALNQMLFLAANEDETESLVFIDMTTAKISKSIRLNKQDIYEGLDESNMDEDDLAFFAIASPDGKFLGAYTYGRISLWKIESNKMIRHTPFIPVSEGSIIMAFSPDGKLFAVIMPETQVCRVYEAESGKMLYTLDIYSKYEYSKHTKVAAFTRTIENGTPEDIGEIIFTPDGKNILLSSINGDIYQWRLNAGETLFEREKGIRDAAFAPDQQSILTVDQSSVKRWDINTQKLIHKVDFNNSDWPPGIFPDGKKIFVAANSKERHRIFDISTEKTVSYLDETIYGAQNKPAFSQDGALMLVGDYASTTLIDIATKKIRKIYRTAGEHLALSADGAKFLSGDFGTRIWNIDSDTSYAHFDRTSANTAVKISPDGEYALIASEDGTVTLLNADNAEKIHTFIISANAGVTALAFSGDGKYFLTGSGNGVIQLWDLVSKSCLQTFARHSTGIADIEFSPDGKKILSVGKDGSVRLWTVGKDCVECFIHPISNAELRAASVELEPEDLLQLWEEGLYLTAGERNRINKKNQNAGNGLIKILDNGRYGFIDSAGTETYSYHDPLVNAVYDQAGKFSDSLANVRMYGKWGYIDMEGETVIPFVYDSAGTFSGGEALVKSNNGWFWIDKTGSEPVLSTLDTLGVYKGESAWAKKNGQYEWFLVDKKGKILTKIDREALSDPDYPADFGEKQGKSQYEFSEGLAPVLKDGKYGFINTENEWVVPNIYESLTEMLNGVAIVTIAGKVGLLDKNNRIVLPAQYDSIGRCLFAGDLRYIYSDGLVGFADTLGNIILSPRYDDFKSAGDGIAAVLKDGKFGFINARCEEIIPPVYDELGFPGSQCKWKAKGKSIEYYCNDLIAEDPGYRPLFTAEKIVAKGLRDSKWEFFEANGAVLPDTVTNVRPAGYRISLLEKNGKFGLYAPDYGIFLRCIYEQTGFPGEENGWIRVQQNGKWGWVDKTGAVMIPFQYDAAMPFENGRARVIQFAKGQAFNINYKGEILMGK